jgi:hypothetical protein
LLYPDGIEANFNQIDAQEATMLSDQFEETVKGILYAQEPERLIVADDYRAILSGHHRNHVLIIVDGEWHCGCSAWQTQFLGRGTGWCRHTIAVIRILAALHARNAALPQVELCRDFELLSH